MWTVAFPVMSGPPMGSLSRLTHGSIAAADGRESKSFYADEHGYFEARGLEPGRYMVGIGIGAQRDSREWRSRVYYPGVRIKENATVIELGKAEKRTNIDFQSPNSVPH
jgi:hypothetical protein